MTASDNTGRNELRSLCAGEMRIPAGLVETLMPSDDREDRAAAYVCITQHWERIRPEMEDWFVGPFVVGYLLECITTPQHAISIDSDAHSNYEAARELVGIVIRRWSEGTNDDPGVTDIVSRVDEAFLKGDQNVRECIETGFLEHVLEHPGLRPLFAHWLGHNETRDAHARALAWGRDHEQPATMLRKGKR